MKIYTLVGRLDANEVFIDWYQEFSLEGLKQSLHLRLKEIKDEVVPPGRLDSDQLFVYEVYEEQRIIAYLDFIADSGQKEYGIGPEWADAQYFFKVDEGSGQLLCCIVVKSFPE